jgi:tight adherence protein B
MGARTLLLIALLVGAGVFTALLAVGLWLRRRELTAAHRLEQAVQALTELPSVERPGRLTALLTARDARGPGRWWGRRRRRLVESQLPDAIDLLVNALRAGHSIPSAMAFVGKEMPAPIGPIFFRFHEEQQLGLGVRDGLLRLQARLGTLDARILVMALLIQRDTGGNLAETLGTIGTIIRERIDFRGQVRVLTAEARLSALVLSLLPPGLFAVLRVVNPGYLESLVSTAIGARLIAYALISLVVGTLWLRRIAAIEV